MSKYVDKTIFIIIIIAMCLLIFLIYKAQDQDIEELREQISKCDHWKIDGFEIKEISCELGGADEWKVIHHTVVLPHIKNETN